MAEFDEFTLDGTPVPMGDVCTDSGNVLTCNFGDDYVGAAGFGDDVNTHIIIMDFNEAIMPGVYTFKARMFTSADTPVFE